MCQNSVMKTVSYTDARNHLAGLIEDAQDNREPITITRNGKASVVMVAEEEYSAMEETLHLLSTPANAERLRESIAQAKSGDLIDGELCD